MWAFVPVMQCNTPDMTMENPIRATKTRRPKPEYLSRGSKNIFQRMPATNNRHCVREPEPSLSEYLGAPYVLACNNGTIALMLAIQRAAEKKMTVTSHTDMAMLSTLPWLRCAPVFMDTEQSTPCLPSKPLWQCVQKKSGIAGALPVHTYGLACDTESLDAPSWRKEESSGEPSIPHP